VILVAVVVALEIQVRLVEEPYRRRVHGDHYGDYAARTGRFVPLTGRFHRRI
jgi:protein-S-isoprenylcysteine O-methyltransferase Ste14